MLICEECKSKAGKHHVVFKGNKSIIIYLPINEINLCKKCHKEIHCNKDMDYRYKVMLQSKLQSLLPDEYYNLEELKSILQLNNLLIKILAKHIHEGDNGYKSTDIVRYLMCGKVYR
jgi:hypothetical protein